jgi:DNA-binding transcriptional MerR regulator
MEQTIPIREISRLTGVNSVTLRAWERRYGLIKPLRTNKGHRLYRREDVALIKEIQIWLARGLAIGKVSELLESGQPENDLNVENIWQNYLGDLLVIMSELNPGKFDAFFNQLFSVYPAELVTDRLILPALESLNQESFGNNVKKAVLVNRLSEYLLMLTQRQRQQTTGKRIAIIQLSTTENFLLNVLLHYGLIMNQVKSELIGFISATEMLFAVEQMGLDGLIIYNNSCSTLGDFQKELSLLAQKISLPIIVGGSLISAVDTDFPAHVHILRESGQQTIFAALQVIFPYAELDDGKSVL